MNKSEHTTSFTGKAPRKGSRTPLNKNEYSEQRDEETGYGYFGARYMDHELMTMWLSVDPMADKYPSISPYAYCAWSPMRLVDPDGNEMSPIFSTEGKLLGADSEGYKGMAIVMEESAFRPGMSHEEAKSKGTKLNEYGSSISISDKEWEKVEANGGTRQKAYLSNKSDERVFPVAAQQFRPYAYKPLRLVERLVCRGCPSYSLQKDSAPTINQYIIMNEIRFSGESSPVF